MFEKTKEYIMGRVDKPEVKDWLILGGLVLAIAIVAFDIIAVRGRNNTLRVEMDALSINTQNQVKMAEKKAAEEIERIKQQIKSFEKRISETKKKAAETESDCLEKIQSLRAEHQKKLQEQKEMYEEKIKNMQADFDERVNKLKARTQKVPSRAPESGVKQNVRCGKCYGSGMVKVKERCGTCNGRGKIEKKSVGQRIGISTSTSTYVIDCPNCLPGQMKGLGSKGYTIESKSCPRCGGCGTVSDK